MATSEAKEIKKQETLVRFSIISYKTRLRVVYSYIECISSKNDQFVIEKFANCYQIKDYLI